MSGALPVAHATPDPHAGVREFASYAGPVRDRCDVVVIGSGPGGAVAAKELAERGLDVVLLEEGPPFGRKDFRTEAGDSMKRTLRESGLRVARGRSFVPTMQAIGLGGGSLVNSAISVRAPRWALDQWASEHDLPALAGGSLDPHYAAVEEFLGIGPTAEEVLGERNLVFKRGCDALGYSSEPTPRNVRGCRGSSECFTGCRAGAKQSTDVSYVPAAIAKGARVYTSVRAERLVADGRRVTAVRGRVVEPFTGRETHEVEIEAKQVVLAAGCMATPLLLLRSGLGGPSGQVGQNLRGHPGLAIMAIFDHPIDPWKGATQGYHSLHFLREGMKLEVLWAPPAILAVRFPGVGLELKEHLLTFDRMAPFDVIVSGKHSRGSVRPKMSGWDPDIRFDVDQRDADMLKRGLGILADIAWAAGATAVLPGVHGVPDILRGKDETRLITEANMHPSHATIGMNHAFGTARMGHDPRESVVDQSGRCHHLDNVFVADTAIFPDSPTVNPMLTCMALARKIAHGMS